VAREVLEVDVNGQPIAGAFGALHGDARSLGFRSWIVERGEASSSGGSDCTRVPCALTGIWTPTVRSTCAPVLSVERAYAAPLHSCKYRWLHGPATKFSHLG